MKEVNNYKTLKNKDRLGCVPAQTTLWNIDALYRCIREMEQEGPLLRIYPEMAIVPRSEAELIYNQLYDQYDLMCVLSNNDFLGK